MTNKWKIKARDWGENHKQHVRQLMFHDSDLYAPSKENLEHPELWKGAHWNWFVKTILLGYEE